MRPLRFTGLFFGLVAVLGAYSCGFEASGLPSTSTSAAAGGAGGADTTSDSTSSSGGALSTTAAGVITGAPGCIPTTEICDNGLDDDCDGDADCADPDCTGSAGYACIPSPPGWTVASFLDAAASCPAGYGAPLSVTTLPTSDASCSCTCGAAPVDICSKGALDIQFGHTSCSSNTFIVTSTGGCDPIGKMIGTQGTGPFEDAAGTGPALVKSPCGASTALPPAQALKTISCAATTLNGKGCSADAVCLPKVNNGAVCIQAAGDMPCPGAAFTKRQVVYAQSDVTDTRSCGPCSCAPNATKCNPGTFTSYDNAQCSGAGVSLSVGVGCKDFNGDNHTHSWFKYTADPDLKTCSVSNPSTVKGTFEGKDPITVCCP